MIRTLENCSLIQKCVRKGIGEPEQRNVNLANSIFPMRKAVRGDGN